MRTEAPIDTTLIAGRIRIGRTLGSGLSRSELVVLCAAANGFTAIETARSLRKGMQTVKAQRGQALLKLRARNTPHAVRLAMTAGILYRVAAGGTARQEPAWAARLVA